MKFIIPLLMILTLLVSPAQADWEPKGPIKLWIGFGAGGGTDTQARALAGELEKARGWRIIPENKAGGGGAVMAASLKNAKPDGQNDRPGYQHHVRLCNPQEQKPFHR